MNEHSSKDNQQEIIDSEIAWLAGVIECDGTISLSCHVRKVSAKPKCGVEIKLYNTDGGIISKAVDIITKLNLSHHISERVQKPMELANGKSYGNNKTMLALTVKNLGDAYLLGKLLHPWMFGEKAKRLELMLQFLSGRLKKIKDNGGEYRNVPIDQDDLTIISSFYKRFVKRQSNKHLIDALLRD